MFRVFVNDGTQEIPNDDIMYIVCKEGIYLKKKLGIMESITPVQGISVLQSVEMTAQMHIKPIPGTLFAQVISFFKEVYNEHFGEAIVLLFYNEERKVYKVVPPAQKVSGGGVDYNRAMTIEGYIMVGDIHSHANMSAFHSGIDDADEKSFDGLHITIGNNKDEQVSISASIVSNGQRFLVDPEDYVNGIRCTIDIDEEVERPTAQYYVWDTEQKKLVPKQTGSTYKVRRYDKRYISTVSKKYQTHPAAWMQLVEKKVYVYSGGYGQGYYGNYGWWRNWDTDKFDPNAWRDFRNQTRSPLSVPPLIPSTTKPITFPEHTLQPANNLPATTKPVETVVPEKEIPCKTCPFQDRGFKWFAERFMELNDDDSPAISVDEQGNEIEWYECVQCAAIVSSTPDGSATCPNCGTDDYLMLMDQDDFEEAVIKSEPIRDLDWYRCTQCSSIFETASTSAICPICKTNVGLVELRDKEEIPKKEEPNYQYKCIDCGTETSVLNHGDCPFCGGKVVDRIDQDALLIAAKEEDEASPIPIPDKDSIPISKNHPRPGVFAKIFGKKKRGNKS